MGITKTSLFTAEQNRIAELGKAFAHPARVAIIQFLIQSQSCINTDLVKELGLAQATISQHLKALKEIGIIQGNIEGIKTNYCINPKTWQEATAIFGDLFDGQKPINCTSNC